MASIGMGVGGKLSLTDDRLRSGGLSAEYPTANRITSAPACAASAVGQRDHPESAGLVAQPADTLVAQSDDRRDDRLEPLPWAGRSPSSTRARRRRWPPCIHGGCGRRPAAVACLGEDKVGHSSETAQTAGVLRRSLSAAGTAVEAQPFDR